MIGIIGAMDEEKLAEYRSEWESYSSKISELFSGEESEE